MDKLQPVRVVMRTLAMLILGATMTACSGGSDSGSPQPGAASTVASGRGSKSANDVAAASGSGSETGSAADGSAGAKSSTAAKSGASNGVTVGARAGEAAPGVAGTGAQAAAGGAGQPSAESDAGQPSSDAADAETSDASAAGGSCAGPASSATKPGFTGDWMPGTYPSNFRDVPSGNYLTIPGLPNQNGTAREYAVHVPPSYDPAVPMPVLFCLHAFSMNALSFCDGMAGWLDKADKEGFIVVMPNGYMNSFNIGPGCGAALIAAYADGIDDVAFIRKLYEEVGKHLNFDLSRVYGTGFSNGAALSWRLACEASDIFTAFVSDAGNICLDSCKPTHKVSMLDIHGTGDILSPPDVHPMSIKSLTTANGCSMTSQPASIPMSAGASTCVTWPGCASECSGSAVEVTECTVQGGSHCWYGDVSTADCGSGAADSDHYATNMAWAFLSRLSR